MYFDKSPYTATGALVKVAERQQGVCKGSCTRSLNRAKFPVVSAAVQSTVYDDDGTKPGIPILTVLFPDVPSLKVCLFSSAEEINKRMINH